MKRYTNKYLIEQSLNVIKENKLVFIDEIFAYTDFSQKLFYLRKLQDLQAIKDQLSMNKIKMKQGLRRKWYINDNSTTQIALYKLISTKKELGVLRNEKGEESGNVDVNITFGKD